MTEVKKADEEMTFVYMGERLSNGKLYVCACPIVEGVALTSMTAFFSGAKKTNLSIGWVHGSTGEINKETGEINSINFGNAFPIREYIGKPDFAEAMRIKTAEARTQKAMITKAKDDTFTKDLRKRLAPIKRAMNKTNHDGKSALLALVIKELTR